MYLTIFSLLGLILVLIIKSAECKCPSGRFGSRCQFQCHCKTHSDCNKDTVVCHSGCVSPWSGRNCQQENISFNVSTDHKAGEGSTDSWLGVDGNTSTCAITKAGDNGWWMVKFQKPKLVYKMFLKSDDNTPMYDWQIMVGENGNLFTMRTCSQLKTYDSTSSIFCDEPQEGQYLAILNPHGPVVICELYVYACSKLSFGLECERECFCKDPTEQCDPQTGFCSSGCRPGRVGIGCQMECFRGRWGSGCKEYCGYCQNRTCDQVNGRCHNPCLPGWTGIKCLQECPVGSFGQDCQEKCGKCKSDITCNITTGVCHDGCEDGYEGDYCTTRPPGDSRFSEDTTNTLQVFLGISVTIVLSVMACLIVCLVSNWRREDISKYDRQVQKCDKEINMEEVRHLNCNGEL